jgi:hypothetical protein
VDFSGRLGASDCPLPAELTVSSAAQPVFRLQVERCWANPELTDEIFRLDPGAEGR